HGRNPISMIKDLETIVERTEQLCERLDRIGVDLVSLDMRTVLEIDCTLARVLAALAAVGAAAEKAALEPVVQRRREALLASRRTGPAFAGVPRAHLQLHIGRAS